MQFYHLLCLQMVEIYRVVTVTGIVYSILLSDK